VIVWCSHRNNIFLGFSIHQVVTLQGMMGRMYAFICKQVCKEKDADATSWTIVPTYRIEVFTVFFQISTQELTGEPKFSNFFRLCGHDGHGHFGQNRFWVVKTATII